MSFLSQMATMAGGATIANTEQQQRQANVESTQTNTAYMKMQSAMMQRKMAQEQDLAKAASYVLNDIKSDATDPMQRVAAYEKLEKTMMQRGNMAGAEEARKAATEARLAAKASQTYAAEQITQLKEGAATAASSFLSSPTPQNAENLRQSALKAGVDPKSIPPTESAAFAGWAQQQRKAALSSKESLDFEQKVKDQDERRAEQVRRDKQLEADRQQRERDARLRSQESLELRRLTVSIMQDREARQASKQGTENLTPKARDTRDQVAQMAGEGVRTLTSLGKFAATQTQGFFPDLTAHNALDSLTKIGGNVMTPEQTQMIQSAAAGFGRAVLVAETAGTGRGPTESQIKQMDRMITGVEGDTPMTVAYKLATGAKIIAARMERLPKNPDERLQKLADEDLEYLKKFPSPDAILEAAKKSTPAARASIRKAGKSMAELLGSVPAEGEAAKPTPTPAPALPSGWTVTVKP